jgi:hypothetical protein
MDWIYRTLSDAQSSVETYFRRDDETSVKDVCYAHAGFAGASHP